MNQNCEHSCSITAVITFIEICFQKLGPSHLPGMLCCAIFLGIHISVLIGTFKCRALGSLLSLNPSNNCKAWQEAESCSFGQYVGGRSRCKLKAKYMCTTGRPLSISNSMTFLWSNCSFILNRHKPHPFFLQPHLQLQRPHLLFKIIIMPSIHDLEKNPSILAVPMCQSSYALGTF